MQPIRSQAGIHRRPTRRHRYLTPILATVTIVLGLVGIPGQARADVVPATVTISSASPAGSFSPNGDSIEDTVNVYFCLDAAANVTGTAVDGNGTTVRTFVDRVSFAAGCQYSVAGWDGRTDAGTLAPDGTYELKLVAVNASGTPTSASKSIVLDRRVPGLVSAPAPGSTLTGTVRFAFTPTPGFTVTQVTFALSSNTVSCATPVVTSPDADGVFRVSYDTADSCGEGNRTLTAQVQFTDSTGANHWWNSTSQTVILSNPAPPVVGLQANGPKVFSPNGDNQEDQTSVSYCVADAVDGGQLRSRYGCVTRRATWCGRWWTRCVTPRRSAIPGTATSATPAGTGWTAMACRSRTGTTRSRSPVPTRRA